MEIVGIDRKFYRTSLVFNYFDKDYLSPDFLPKISGLASYGVLGRFGRHQGYIYSDDEDAQGYDHNFNYSYIDGNGDHTLEFENISMPNMMDFGQNIRLYISEFAGNCENYF